MTQADVPRPRHGTRGRCDQAPRRPPAEESLRKSEAGDLFHELRVMGVRMSESRAERETMSMRMDERAMGTYVRTDGRSRKAEFIYICLCTAVEWSGVGK